MTKKIIALLAIIYGIFSISLLTAVLAAAAAEIINQSPKLSPYLYEAFVTEVYDGDSITADIRLGLGIWKKGEKIRLYGINTPEIRGGTPEEKAHGFAARDYLRALILNKAIILETHKDKTGKYGRLLGTIWIDGVNVNLLLIDKGHAVEYLLWVTKRKAVRLLKRGQGSVKTRPLKTIDAKNTLMKSVVPVEQRQRINAPKQDSSFAALRYVTNVIIQHLKTEQTAALALMHKNHQKAWKRIVKNANKNICLGMLEKNQLDKTLQTDYGCADMPTT